MYNWKRFWCPREGKINLSDQGYLVDPDLEWGKAYNPDLASLEDIVGVPCLIFLGEPGIGKSSTIKNERENIKIEIERGNKRVLFVDLRSYGSEDRIIKGIFQSSVFIEWLQGKYQLHIYLDSFDECLLRIDNLSALLLAEFRKYPVERLFLRVASRTAEWPISLEEGLKEIWGEDSTKIYELAPLRKVDVIEAARSNDLDGVKFLDEIDLKEVVPFAIKPVTLNFLLNIYVKNMQFPSTKKDLYLEGCRLLCEDLVEGRPSGVLNSKQRMLIAARIGAVTMFSNKYAIWKDRDLGNVPGEDVLLNKFSEGIEVCEDRQFSVTEDAVMETLATGLFSSRGPHRMGWSHQTFAEFLGSWYLIQKKVDLVQILSLISHPEDPERRIPPQLHESVGWLATMMPELFQYLIERDPEVLLRSDVTIFESRDCEKLVDSLLKLAEEDKFARFSYDINKWFRKLVHPNLEKQLRLYISDKLKSADVREIAIDIAEACELKGLQNKIVAIALDQSDQVHLRHVAASAIAFMGDPEIKKLLRPLALGTGNVDPDDQLKGYGLRAVWPEHITSTELFIALTSPKNPNLIGSYEMFLAHDLKKSIQLIDLIEALKWSIKQEQQFGERPRSFRQLADIFIDEAWKKFDLPGIEGKLAELVLLRLKKHDAIGCADSAGFNNLLKDSDVKRRRLIQATSHLLTDPDKESVYLVWSQTPLVLEDDVVWLGEQLRIETPELQRNVLAHLIIRKFDWANRKQLKLILRIRKYSPLIKKHFSLFWLLSALYATPLFRLYGEYRKRKHYPKDWFKQNRKVRIDSQDRINKLLKRCEIGDFNAWWRLNMEMTLKENSSHYENEFESDLHALPGWEKADAQMKLRIIQAAKQYVLNADPNVHKWINNNILHRPAFAGYRALRLLLKEDREFIANLSQPIWRKWVPIIVSYPLSGSNNEDNQELIRTGYQQASDEFIKTLLILIDKENKEHDHVFIVRKIESCMNDQLAEILLNKIRDEKLKPKCFGDILEILLKYKYSPAKAYSESLLQNIHLPAQFEEREKLVITAQMLVNVSDDGGWSVIWPLLQSDIEFGKEIVSYVAHDSAWHSAHIGKKLTEDQLADLYLWLVKEYPVEEDSKSDGFHSVGPRESVARWRDGVLNQLKDRGTYRACEAIKRIIQALPKFKKWLNLQLLDAQNIARQHTWMPPEPEDILRLTKTQQSRFVQNGEQLLDVLIESLSRLEAKLQGETPAVPNLWNEINHGIWEPKDENHFTDYIKLHLEEDLRHRGIVINREVQIRRGTGGQPGERTDIHVDAIKCTPNGDEFNKVSVIIEAKGCWHKELGTAMKDQLTDRYLKDNLCQFGLYLVGWFLCKQWNDNDPRKKQVPNILLKEARERFNSQANELSKQNDILTKAFVINASLR